MKMVLEEIEGNIACLIPDVPHFEPMYIAVQKLPSGSVLGDVFEVEVELPSFNLIHLSKVEGEKDKRLNRIKEKRERLLRRPKED